MNTLQFGKSICIRMLKSFLSLYRGGINICLLNLFHWVCLISWIDEFHQNGSQSLSDLKEANVQQMLNVEVSQESCLYLKTLPLEIHKKYFLFNVRKGENMAANRRFQ